MINLQYYKIVDKKTQESIILDYDVMNANLLTTFLKENNAFPNYKTFYEIYLCFDGIHIIHGVETPAKTETRINPIFLMNKNTKEVVESMAMPMLLLFFENNNIADYELFYDDEVDNGETLAGYNEIFVNKQKAILLANLEIKYKNTRQIHIKNGYQFTIDFTTEDGKKFIDIVKQSNLEIGDYNTASPDKYKPYNYFQTIEQAKDGITQKLQINVLILNWLWSYIFKEVVLYDIENKKKFEAFKVAIGNSKTLQDLQNIKIEFLHPAGLVVNVAITFKKLMLVAVGKDTDFYIQYHLENGAGTDIQVELKMPKEVKEALLAESKKPYPIFDIVDITKIDPKIDKIIANSFFNK